MRAVEYPLVEMGVAGHLAWYVELTHPLPMLESMIWITDMLRSPSRALKGSDEETIGSDAVDVETRRTGGDRWSSLDRGDDHRGDRAQLDERKGNHGTKRDTVRDDDWHTADRRASTHRYGDGDVRDGLILGSGLPVRESARSRPHPRGVRRRVEGESHLPQPG